MNTIICGAVPILHFVLMLFVPDTPRYHLQKGEVNKAARALQWLRGADTTEDVERELKEVN